MPVDDIDQGGAKDQSHNAMVCYGQVQSYIYVTLPAESHLKTNQNLTAILALVALCKTNGKDASLEPVWCQDMEIIRAFNITTSDCVVGQIKVGDRWGIIDRSYGSQQMDYGNQNTSQRMIIIYFVF